MKYVDTKFSARRKLRRTGYVMACVIGLLAAACGLSYLHDSAKLRAIAVRETHNIKRKSDIALALATWVHDNKGFRENDDYFVLKGVRATPIQVVEGGGDCADKSRLLCSLLRQVGIRSTMVMCFHRDTNLPTHTVVEAETDSGQYMVVDPVYGLAFPKDTEGSYYGLLELRAEPQILDRRLDDLLANAQKHSPLQSYNPASAAYDHASSINWDKNIATKAAYFALHFWYGEEVHRLRRPLILEEPKLFVANLLTLLAICIALVARMGPSLVVRLGPVTSTGAALCGR